MVNQQETADEIRARRRKERNQRRKRAAQRQGVFYIFCIVSLGSVYWYAQGDLTPRDSYAYKAKVVLDEAQRTMLPESEKSAVSSLDASDRRRLEQQRSVVQTAASRHVRSACAHRARRTSVRGRTWRCVA